MPSHPDRVRRNYSVCFERGEHNWIVKVQSDIAPFIELNGSRTTYWMCIDCGENKTYTRTQEEFLKELNA